MGLLGRPGGQGLFCLGPPALGLQGFLSGLLVGLGGPLHPGHEASGYVPEAGQGTLGHDALDDAGWGSAVFDRLAGDGDEGAGGRAAQVEVRPDTGRSLVGLPGRAGGAAALTPA